MDASNCKDAVPTSAAKLQSRRSKPNRRDPAKRRQQNRQAQKVYREKQKQRIQELERRAGVSEPPGQLVGDNTVVDQQLIVRTPQAHESSSTSPNRDTYPDVVSPDQLQSYHNAAPKPPEEPWDNTLLSINFDQWLSEGQAPSQSTDALAVSPIIFFNCGCPVLHIPMRASPVLLPVIPDLYSNNLRLDRWCVVAAMLENCLQVGITRVMFCSDDAVSPFYRQQSEAPIEDTGLVSAVQRVFKTLHYDLRPTRKQIVKNHHPYIDVIPFRDIRENLIDQSDDIDEDEFFHDALNHLTCWGGVQGAQTGSPWDSRSWEASEMFLKKWSVIVGGEDGELTRQSRWWRQLRGDNITEIF